MPTYDYRCAKCGEDLEVYQSFAEAPLTKHTGCGGKLTKVMSPAGIVLKGSGFYKTDNRESSKRSSSKESAAAAKDSGTRDSGGSSKADSTSNSNGKGGSEGSSGGDSKKSDSGSGAGSTSSSDAKKPTAKSA